MTDLKLLPCPFCGGEARISTRMDEDIWSHNTVPYTQVTCGDCDIGTDYLCEGWEPTAPEAWNRRATPPLLQKEEGVRVLNALDVLERMRLPATATLDAAEFLRLMGAAGMWVMPAAIATRQGEKP